MESNNSSCIHQPFLDVSVYQLFSERFSEFIETPGYQWACLLKNEEVLFKSGSDEPANLNRMLEETRKIRGGECEDFIQNYKDHQIFHCSLGGDLGDYWFILYMTPNLLYFRRDSIKFIKQITEIIKLLEARSRKGDE